MHEMPVVESILGIVLKYAEANQVQRIVSISLMVGEMSDLEPEWLQSYFEFFSRETMAEGAVLKITRTPVVLACNDCGNTVTVTRDEMAEIICPACQGKRFNLHSGNEYYIKDMEVI
ncbi:MAG: hydrogenase maturation nickel metallochaperone HypA [Methylocystaceae bacterium]